MTRANGCTIEEFAETTGIPASFLKEVGVTEVNRRRHQAVRLSNAVAYLAPLQDGAAEATASSAEATAPRCSASTRSTSLAGAR